MSGAVRIMMETPPGMYPGHSPSAMRRSRPLAASAMIEGAATTTARNPMPSKKRLAINCGASKTRLPQKPLIAIKASPPMASRQ
jgi:hypothetical protein